MTQRKPLSIDQRRDLAARNKGVRQRTWDIIYHRPKPIERPSVPERQFELRVLDNGWLVLFMLVGGRVKTRTIFPPEQADLAEMALRAFSGLERMAREMRG